MVFEIYKDVLGGWRWRLKAANGRIIADSGESYRNRVDLYETLLSIRKTIKSSSYTVTEKDGE